MSETVKKFIGQGITFPIELNSNGRPNIETGVNLIRSSIKNLLSWPYATRYFLGEYGSRLNELLEEPNDDILKNLVRYFVIDSISKFEKRISLLETSIIKPTAGSIHIKLKYKINNSSTTDSFIFPFYDKIKY